MNFRFKLSNRSALEPAETPTVCVVDSDAAVREELDRLIRSAGWQPRMAASAEEFLARPRSIAPGCLILDQKLPGMSGLELQKRLLERSELPLIFLSFHPDIHTTVHAMKAGAFEFLTKPTVADEIIVAMRQAIERSHVALRQLERVQALQQRYESLSRREREVMSLVVTGRLNKQVGGELGISEITVKTHRGKLMRKMQAGSFAELINMAANLPGGGPNYAIQE